MTLPLSTLFSNCNVNDLTIPTRFVMAPMTRERSPNGIPNTEVAAYYERRARNKIGLIITEGTGIPHPASVGGINIPLFYGERPLGGWKIAVDTVHAAGGRIMPQLWHQGAERRNHDEPHPEAPSISPSGINREGKKIGDPMEQKDIDAVVQAFSQASLDAKGIGFDGIEIHGAHGYLIDQFFWDFTNRRTDFYGGSLKNRTRFASEIIQACREAVGPSFPIIFRLSQWKVDAYEAKIAPSPQELEQLLSPLASAGVDIFHCSTRRFWEPEFPNSDLNFAGWTKKITGRPVITVGSIGTDIEEIKAYLDGHPSGKSTLEIALGMIERGEVDLLAVGRHVLADPQWATKVAERRSNEFFPVTEDVFKTLY